MKKLFIFSVICLVMANCSPFGGSDNLGQSGSGHTASTTPLPVIVTPQASVPVGTSGLPNFDHIVLIMLENQDYAGVIGNPQMPQVNGLATQNVLLSNYHAVAHPSLPNYIALMSGSTQHITSDCTKCFVNAPNLADLIEASGRTWKSYLEDLPSPCFVGDAGNYAQKHDPLIYFDSIRLNATRCEHSIVPLTNLDGDLANNQLPNFSFIMPNLCNSGHDCSVDVADKWVGGMVAKLQASPALGNNSLIVIAFDEASDQDKSGCCGMSDPAGGRVAVVMISPTALPDMTDDTPYSHYSLLKTILTAWNLPALGQTAQDATQAIVVPWTGQHSQSVAPNPTAPAASMSETGSIAVAQTPEQCSTSSPTNGTYSVVVCLSNLASGSTLNGDVTITPTITSNGSAQVKVAKVVFYLDGTYLLTSYSSPYSFTLPTEDWVDGKHTLSVEADMRDNFITQQGGVSVEFKNGVLLAPVNSKHFQPTSGIPAVNGAPFVVAAGGDGASGEQNSVKVTDLIASLKPNLFLYLGDVYEDGSQAEFYNWYGDSSTFFGKFRSITDPTIGNHEYLTPGASGYFNYWDNIPNYYSFDAGGWHFISLNANDAQIRVDAASDQYQWLKNDLTANSQKCTIAYYHEPFLNIGAEPAATYMADIWGLLAQYGVSIVLNGHDHDYQRWMPVDGKGQLSQKGITEFVVGSAGHGIQKFTKTDSRVAYANDSRPAGFGILLLALSQNTASFTYKSTNGSILDSGSIPCVHASPVSSVP